MYKGHILPPELPGRYVAVNLAVEALLTEIFQNDFPPLYIFVAWLYCAVAAASVAVVLEVLFLAEGTLPEHVSGSHEHLLSEALVLLLEVLHEIEGAIV